MLSLPSYIPRHSSSDFTFQDQSPHARRPPKDEGRTAKTTIIRVMTTFRCDAFRKGTTPKTPPSHVQERTGFSPLEEDARGGKHDAPNGETAPTGVAVIKAFAQRYLSFPFCTNAGPDDRLASHHRRRKSHPAPPVRHRRASCTWQTPSCADRHPSGRAARGTTDAAPLLPITSRMPCPSAAASPPRLLSSYSCVAACTNN